MVVQTRQQKHRHDELPEGARGLAASSAQPRGCSSQKVRRLSRRLSQHFDHIVADAGLKTTQYSLLSHIVQLGPLRPGELARAMDLDASTLTRNLQPLVGAGWVEVGPGDDERSRAVSATAAGRAKQAEAQRSWKRAQIAFNERLGVELVGRLHALVDECMARLDETESQPEASAEPVPRLSRRRAAASCS